MLKIGILGSDNSHAERFSEILNRPDHAAYLPGADAKVVAIWGAEPERTQQVARDNLIETIAATPEAMLGQVDAVFCVTRHGGLHLDLVRPYLQAGVPTFVDKPLAIDPADAREIVELAAATHTPLTSFSTVRFSADAQRFFADARQLGGIRAAIYSGPANRRNPYGGILFYAIHCIELLLMNQGTGVQWVQAIEGPGIDAAGNGNLIATCAWADGATATLQCTVDAKYSFQISALGAKETLHTVLDISDCYREGMKQILACLRGGDNPVSPAQMIEAIQIGAAIERSLAQGKRIALSEL
ncbi:MAG: Gfo/Idh/MocA family oxidoreductase [Chloroflexi bacterium]|nr:Gfo/Idh/MocA family oxidoreductase [Chloroflexota bacterium]